MSENKIRSLAPYVARLTWIWARRAIMYMKGKSTQDREVIKWVELAADKGDPEGQWWSCHNHLIVTMALNEPDSYSSEDLMRAKYHYYLYTGGISPRDGLMQAAVWGHPDAILQSAEWISHTLFWPPLFDSEREILKKAADMGSVDALKTLKVDLASHRASIEERALNGCYEAAAHLTEYETGNEHDPELDSNRGKECTANDALWRFLLIFSGLLHPKIVQNRHLDDAAMKVVRTINSGPAIYQFGLCTHQMIDVIPERMVQSFKPFLLYYRRASESAKEAVNAWIFVGRCSGICRDMRKMIGEMIWADRTEWMITATTKSKEESASKRVKI